jgi:hypothetical protein
MNRFEDVLPGLGIAAFIGLIFALIFLNYNLEKIMLQRMIVILPEILKPKNTHIGSLPIQLPGLVFLIMANTPLMSIIVMSPKVINGLSIVLVTDATLKAVHH